MRRVFPIALFCLATVGLAAQAIPDKDAQGCTQLSVLKLPNTDVVSTDFVPSTSPLGETSTSSPGAALKPLPAHCVVKLRSHPSADSDIHVEIWLPRQLEWNGRLLGTGNGGYSGRISYEQMAAGLALGYAVGASDTGHTGDDLQFGVGHPEKVKDWAYRATHTMAELAHVLIRIQYGVKARHAYFEGCSTGGQQALSEAQRYPADFDGIIAGDPGNDRVRLNADFAASWLITHPSQHPHFPAEKLAPLHRALIAACDELDGIKDGVVTNPDRCTFDPGTIECAPGTDSPECLTQDEVAMARALYAGPLRDASGASLFPGWSKSSEAGWGAYLINSSEPVRFSFWRNWVYDDESLQPKDLHVEDAIRKGRQKFPYLDAIDADLHSFQARGGKLLLYHGWSDPVVPAHDTIDYYQDVERHMGSSTRDFARLFMVSGMGHCGGGPGATQFDVLEALDGWVSHNEVPDRITAAHQESGKTLFTRPLCPFPLEPHYDGLHNQNDASSFACLQSSTPGGNK